MASASSSSGLSSLEGPELEDELLDVDEDESTELLIEELDDGVEEESIGLSELETELDVTEELDDGSAGLVDD